MSSETVQLTLPRSASSPTSVTTLRDELVANESLFEPILMRRGGGWLDGPVKFEVLAIRFQGDVVRADLRITYRTQCVPGCGTSAVASEGHVTAVLELDCRTGQAIVRFGD